MEESEKQTERKGLTMSECLKDDTFYFLLEIRTWKLGVLAEGMGTAF